MSDRRLVSIRRAVPAAREEEYAAAWEAVAEAARPIGAHAWRFRSLDTPTLHLEFLEWKEGDARTHPPVAAALSALDRIATAEPPESWIGG